MKEEFKAAHLLDVEELSVEYWVRERRIRAVDDISFFVDKAETLGVVGESGSGKSTLALSLIRLVPYPGRIISGKVTLEGQDLLNMKKERMRSLRGGKISYVFQDPMTSLNPVRKIGTHFVELIQTHEPKTTEKEALERGRRILENVGIQPERINDYPHQLSGGMRQRVMIGLAIALNPSVIIADEPTTALDVIVQARILDLLNSLRDDYGMALILISHDLSIVLERSTNTLVMYAGQMVEYARSEDIFMHPQHPYTKGLLESIPNVELEEQTLKAIAGLPPDMLDLPRGCRFWSRCNCSKPPCKECMPPLVRTGPEHLVRCSSCEETLET